MDGVLGRGWMVELVGVLVGPGNYNKDHRPGGLNSKHLCLTFWRL